MDRSRVGILSGGGATSDRAGDASSLLSEGERALCGAVISRLSCTLGGAAQAGEVFAHRKMASRAFVEGGAAPRLQPWRMAMVLRAEKPYSASKPFSRPKPEPFMPPNGSSTPPPAP
jgi:hypothetical protein